MAPPSTTKTTSNESVTDLSYGIDEILVEILQVDDFGAVIDVEDDQNTIDELTNYLEMFVGADNQLDHFELHEAVEDPEFDDLFSEHDQIWNPDKKRDILFTKIYRMYGESAEAYMSRICDRTLYPDVGLDVDLSSEISVFKDNFQTLLEYWNVKISECRIPASQFTAISKLLYWQENPVDQKRYLTVSVEFYTLDRTQQIRLVETVNAIILHYDNLRASEKEKDPVKKKYYVGLAALYVGHVEEAKISLYEFLQEIPLTPDEAILNMYETASYVLRNLEIQYCATLRQQIQSLYSERVAVNFNAEKYSYYRDESLILLDKLEEYLRNGLANTLSEAMQCERFAYEEALANLDVGITVQSGWCVEYPYPIPKINSEEYNRWAKAAQTLLSETKDPKSLQHVDVPSITLKGGTIVIPEIGLKKYGYPPFLLNVNIAPEGGVIVLGRYTYKFPPANQERCVSIQGFNILFGELTSKDYQKVFAENERVNDIFADPSKKDPVFQRLLALDTPEAWKIASDPESKAVLGLVAARELADQGSIDSASEILEGILSSVFESVAKNANPNLLNKIVAECNSESFSAMLRTSVIDSLESFKSQSLTDFLKRYPKGWPLESEIQSMVELQREVYISAKFGQAIWELVHVLHDHGMLKCSSIESEALSLLNDLIGLDPNPLFPSEKTSGELSHMLAEEALWQLPMMAVSLGVGSLARIGIRSIPAVGELFLEASRLDNAAKVGYRVFSLNTMLYGATSLLEGAAVDGLSYVWSDGADPIRVSDIAYFGALNLAFHGMGVASNRAAVALRLGPEEIMRMPQLSTRLLASGTVLTGTIVSQASLMSLSTALFHPEAELANNYGVEGNFFINLIRASMNHAGMYTLGSAAKKAVGISPFEAEQRSIERIKYAQAQYLALNAEYPGSAVSLRLKSALATAEMVVPNARTYLPVQRGLTVEQETLLRQKGLLVLLDHWSAATQNSGDGYLAEVEEYERLHRILESKDALTNRQQALEFLDQLEAYALRTLGKAKGLSSNDGMQPHMGYARAIEMAYEARNLRATQNVEMQLSSVALAIDTTQGNSINKQAMTQILKGVALLAREYFGEGPMLYSEPLADNPGETSLSNRVVLQLQLSNTELVSKFLENTSGFLADMIISQQALKADLERAIRVASSDRKIALETYGLESDAFRDADLNLEIALGRLQQVNQILDGFRIQNGEVQVKGNGENGEEWFSLSLFQLKLNAAIENLDMSVIYGAKHESYVHAEVKRARDEAIIKAEYMQKLNQGKEELPVSSRLMPPQANVPENFSARPLFPQGQYLSLDDLTQNLVRLFDNSLTVFRTSDSSILGNMPGIQNHSAITQLQVLKGTLLVRALQIAGENAAIKVDARQIFDALQAADQRLTDYDDVFVLARRDALRREELIKIGIDFDACVNLAESWYKILRQEMTNSLFPKPPLLDSYQVRTAERDVLYRDFHFENLSPESKLIVLELQQAFSKPLVAEEIALYRALGGIIEPSRVLRYIYDGAGPKGEKGLFTQIDELRERLKSDPSLGELELTSSDYHMLEILERTNLVAIDFMRSASFDPRDRITRPWALYSQASLKSIQEHYLAIKAEHPDALAGVEKPGFYQFGIEVSHAKDRESAISPWDENYYFDPNMVPIRRINKAVADYLSEKRGATVVVEAYAMGDEMVATIAKHDSLGRLITREEISEAYHVIMKRDFPETFQYNAKVMTRIGNPSKGIPHTIERLPQYFLKTPNGVFVVAEDVSFENGTGLGSSKYYILQFPDGTKPPENSVPELLTFQDIVAQKSRFGFDSIDDLGNGSGMGLYPVEGPIQLRLASVEYSIEESNLYSFDPLSQNARLRQMLDASALTLMQYDEVVKKMPNPTSGQHPLSTQYLLSIQQAFPEYATWVKP